jgi:hypothetical protein
MREKIREKKLSKFNLYRDIIRIKTNFKVQNIGRYYYKFFAD